MIHRKVQPVSERRRRTQKGLEAIEFGLWALLVMPPFVWMFINGINFIRYNKASDVTRSTAMMYIKGLDMAALGNQKVVQRVANGLNLQVESGGAVANNLGDGMVVVTKVQYIGPTCGCANASRYVIMQRMYIGNRSLSINGSTAESFVGPPPAGIWNSATGSVANFMTNSASRASAAFTSLWGTSLANGQIVYVVESFFKTPSMGQGEFDSRGIYSRVFM